MNFKQWLAGQFTALDSVRGCAIDRDADIVVFMWGGTIIRVHLLGTPPKTRQIKKLISDNSRVGIGTLFLIDAELVPDDGEKLELDESLLALHALFKDKVYTYRVDEQGVPHIGQVHLKSFGRGHEHEVWYGPDVPVRALPCFRVWVRTPTAIKGEWLIANLGSEAFWKHADYSASRDAFRRQQRQSQSQTHYATWSQTGWDEHGSRGHTTFEQGLPHANPLLSRDLKLKRSYTQLGLEHGASSDEVKAAFRRMARELHPDVSHLPKDEAENRFKTLNEAYTYIKVKNGW